MSVPGLNGTHAWSIGAGGLSPHALDGTPSGLVLNTGRGSWPRYKLSAIPGLRSRREAEYSAASPVGRSGELPRPVIARGKTVVYDGTVRARTLLELEAAIDRLEAAFADDLLGTMSVDTLLGLSAFSVSGNSVANSSFEGYDAAGVPSSWSGYNASISSVADASAQHGSRSCEVTKTDASSVVSYLIQDTPRRRVIPGQSVTVSAWVKGGTNYANVNVGLRAFNAAGAWVANVLGTNVSENGVWQLVTATFVMDSSWDSVGALVTFIDTGSPSNGLNGVRWVDAVQVQDGGTRTLYSPSTYRGPFRYRAIPTALDVPEEHPAEIAQHRATRGFERRFTVALRLPDPRFYGSVLRTARGSAHSSAPLSINSSGAAPTDPLLRIYGPVTSPTVTNQAGKTVSFSGAVASGEVLEVDFTTRTSTLVTGGTRKPGLTLNRQASTWWDGDTPGLTPGMNTLTLMVGNVDVRDLQVDWYDAWVS